MAISAQATRAILLASATITSIGGLRASMRASQEPAGTPLRLAQRTTPQAATISRRRSALLAAGRPLHGREPDPGGEVSTGSKGLGRRRERLDRCRDQGSNPGHRHEPARRIVGLGPFGDLAVKRRDLVLQGPQRLDEPGDTQRAKLGRFELRAIRFASS